MAQVAESPTTEHPLYVVDAFAKEAFTGNPAAVCLLNADTVSERLFSLQVA